MPRKPYDWQDDPEWGDDPGDRTAFWLILLATLALGIGMYLLWTVAEAYP